MSTHFTRSALIFWGHNPGPDVAAVAIDHGERRVITWDDLRLKKIERQERSLRWKRSSPVDHAYRVWVAYYDQFIFGGWQAMISRQGESHWIDRDRRWLIPKLLKQFPLVLPIGSEYEQWQSWKVEFARQFKRRTQDRKPLGVAFVWWDGHSRDLRKAK